MKMQGAAVRTYIPEKKQERVKPAFFGTQPSEHSRAVYSNRRRVKGRYVKGSLLAEESRTEIGTELCAPATEHLVND